MAVYQDHDKKGKVIKTKDGRNWYFKVYKKDFQGNNKAFKSQRYLTKKEAQEAERLFLMKRDTPIRKNFNLIAIDFLNEYKCEQRQSTYETAKTTDLLTFKTLF